MVRTALGRRQRIRKRRRLPKQLEPRPIALAYFAVLRQLLERARELVQRRLVPRLPAIAAARGDRAIRTDAGSRDVNKLMDEVADQFYRGLGGRELEALAGSFASRTSEFQRRELNKQLQAAVGVEVPYTDRKLRPMIDDFVAENVALIKSIPQRFFDQVEQQVISGVREGLRWEDLADKIQQRYNVAESSAKLVARDQVGKFYGELNKVRQEELGVGSYIWRTVSDNRVREEHEARDGKKFKWEDPPEDGHPGIPINCRCYAEPVLDEILAELDKPEARPAEIEFPKEVQQAKEPEPVIPQKPAWVGEVQGPGADLANEYAPKLANILGASLTADTGTLHHLVDAAKLPSKVLRSVRDQGVTVHMGKGGVAELGTEGTKKIMALLGQTGDGRKYTELGGVYWSTRREVLIGNPSLGGSASVAIHEIAHAYDFTRPEGKWSDSASFRLAYSGWRDDVKRMLESEGEVREKYREFSGSYHSHPYFTGNARAPTADMEETYAEAFAEYWAVKGGEKGRDAVEKKFGRTIAQFMHAHAVDLED